MITEYKGLFKNKRFIHLWGSQLLSQLTIQIMNFLILVRLFEKTGSTIATSFFWVAYALPAIIVGPIGAAFVDLVDRKLTLQVTNLLQALTVLLYAFGFEGSIYLSYYVVFFYSLFNQFYVPAESASLPSIIEKKQLPSANSIFFITQQSAIILGFGLAGALSHVIGYQQFFFIAAAMLTLAFVSVSFLPSLKPETDSQKSTNFERKFVDFFQKIAEGYNYIKSHKDILMPIVLLMGLHSAVAIMTVNLPFLGQSILNIPANLTGVLVVIPAGVGALIGSVTVSKILKKGVRKKPIMEGAALGVFLSLLTVSIVLPYLPFYLRLLVGGGLFTVVGASYVGLFIPAQTYLQEVTPDEVRGRVFGNFWFMATIVAVIPVIFSSTLVEFLGVRSALILIALFALSIFWFSKKRGPKILEGIEVK